MPGRLLLTIAIGLVGAAIVHIAVIFAMPWVAENSAWNRLSQLGEPFATVRVPGGTDGPFAFVDPAFEVSVCRFDTASAPVRLTTGPNAAFWTVGVFSHAGDNLFGINQRAANDDTLDLVIGTQDQLDQARIAGLLDESDAIPVAFDATEGYAILRAAVEQPSLLPPARAFADTLACNRLPIPDPA